MIIARLLAVLALLLTVACGGGEGGRSPVAPTPVVPQGPPPFAQTLRGTVSVFGTTRHALPSTPRAGTLTLRLTWDNSLVDLDLYLAGSSCVELYPRAQCLIFGASNAARGVTSETITRTVAAGEAFNIFVDSLSLTTPQSYSLDLAIQ
jgi:hypothetical protein